MRVTKTQTGGIVLLCFTLQREMEVQIATDVSLLVAGTDTAKPFVRVALFALEGGGTWASLPGTLNAKSRALYPRVKNEIENFYFSLVTHYISFKTSHQRLKSSVK